MALGSATALLAPLLTGCDVRLEDDAPDLPLLPRKSIPDEALLIAGVHEAEALAQLVGRIAGASAPVAALSSIHLTQAQVLHGRLTAGGVPDHVIASASPTSTGTGTATGTSTTGPAPAVSAPPAATLADLAAAESAGVAAAALTALARATTTNRMVLAAIAAQRGATATSLDSPPTWPAADPLSSSAAAQLLAATRSVSYAFQVAAAQSSGDARTAALSTRDALERRGAELAAMVGSTAPAPPLGYVLPFPVTTPEAAGRLATTAMTGLVAAGWQPLADGASLTASSSSTPSGPVTATSTAPPSATSSGSNTSAVPVGSSALITLLRLQVEAIGLAAPWGVGAVPFPGMSYP